MKIPTANETKLVGTNGALIEKNAHTITAGDIQAIIISEFAPLDFATLLLSTHERRSRLSTAL